MEQDDAAKIPAAARLACSVDRLGALLPRARYPASTARETGGTTAAHQLRTTTRKIFTSPNRYTVLLVLVLVQSSFVVAVGHCGCAATVTAVDGPGAALLLHYIQRCLSCSPQLSWRDCSRPVVANLAVALVIGHHRYYVVDNACAAIFFVLFT